MARPRAYVGAAVTTLTSRPPPSGARLWRLVVAIAMGVFLCPQAAGAATIHSEMWEQKVGAGTFELNKDGKPIAYKDSNSGGGTETSAYGPPIGVTSGVHEWHAKLIYSGGFSDTPVVCLSTSVRYKCHLGGATTRSYSKNGGYRDDGGSQVSQHTAPASGDIISFILDLGADETAEATLTVQLNGVTQKVDSISKTNIASMRIGTYLLFQGWSVELVCGASGAACPIVAPPPAPPPAPSTVHTEMWVQKVGAGTFELNKDGKPIAYKDTNSGGGTETSAYGPPIGVTSGVHKWHAKLIYSGGFSDTPVVCLSTSTPYKCHLGGATTRSYSKTGAYRVDGGSLVSQHNAPASGDIISFILNLGEDETAEATLTVQLNGVTQKVDSISKTNIASMRIGTYLLFQGWSVELVCDESGGACGGVTMAPAPPPPPSMPPPATGSYTVHSEMWEQKVGAGTFELNKDGKPIAYKDTSSGGGTETSAYGPPIGAAYGVHVWHAKLVYSGGYSDTPVVCLSTHTYYKCHRAAATTFSYSKNGGFRVDGGTQVYTLAEPQSGDVMSFWLDLGTAATATATLTVQLNGVTQTADTFDKGADIASMRIGTYLLSQGWSVELTCSSLGAPCSGTQPAAPAAPLSPPPTAAPAAPPSPPPTAPPPEIHDEMWEQKVGAGTFELNKDGKPIAYKDTNSYGGTETSAYGPPIGVTSGVHEWHAKLIYSGGYSDTPVVCLSTSTRYKCHLGGATTRSYSKNGGYRVDGGSQLSQHTAPASGDIISFILDLGADETTFATLTVQLNGVTQKVDSMISKTNIASMRIGTYLLFQGWSVELVCDASGTSCPEHIAALPAASVMPKAPQPNEGHYMVAVALAMGSALLVVVAVVAGLARGTAGGGVTLL